MTWVEGRFRRGLAVVVDPGSGRIRSVEASVEASVDEQQRGEREAVPLPGRALIPGFVNAHSHAFQRLGRGRTQSRPAARDAADFWSWRETMYGIALALDAGDVYDVSRFCFLEMLRTGVTAVGEFHYVHHQPDGTAYRDPNELALRVIAAAEDVGLRIALLNVCYATGGIGEPLEHRQRRFRSSSVDEFLERTGRLHDLVSAAGGVRRPDAGLVTVGVAPHSVRAVPREWLPTLRSWAGERDVPLHMHVSERPAEVAQCERQYGLRPVELLAEDGLLDGRFTAVHATHLNDHEVRLLGDSGATVCACPTTERDLGDGFLRGLDLLDAGTPICLGTDSHTSLDFLAEMRLLEYHERLRRLERVTITDGAPGGAEWHRVAPPLMEMSTMQRRAVAPARRRPDRSGSPRRPGGAGPRPPHARRLDR